MAGLPNPGAELRIGGGYSCRGMAAHAPGKRKALEGIKTVPVEGAPPSKEEGSDNESKLGGAQNWAR
jgi:hypothetical protein